MQIRDAHVRQDEPDPKPHAISGPSTVTVLRADLLIPGRGDPIKNGAIVVRSDKIEWVGASKDIPSKYRNVEPTCVPVLMPGLWDCHVHYLGLDMGGELSKLSPYLPGHNALAGALVVDDMRRTLMAGITSVRDLGGYGCDVWPGVKLGYLVGPNIYGAVAPLSITGGHGDEHDQNLESVLQAFKSGMPGAICDGVEDCTRVVRTIVRRGARVIKVCSSGGVLSLNDDPEDRQFSDAELKAIVEEAGRSRRAVAAHAIGKAGIMAALRAGVTSIEHGMYLDEEAADLMIKQGTILVPTQQVVRVMSDHYFDTLPKPSQDKLTKIKELSKDMVRFAVKKGVKIAIGTDTMSSDADSWLSHGKNMNELVWAVEVGMTPLQAIEAATANAPETLGGMAPRSGQLKEGYDADIIAVCRDPLDDIAVLVDPGNISHVWKGGKLFKGST